MMTRNTFFFKEGLLYQYIGKTMYGLNQNDLYMCVSISPLKFEIDTGIKNCNTIKKDFCIPQNLSNRQLMDLNGRGNDTMLSKNINPYLIKNS